MSPTDIITPGNAVAHSRAFRSRFPHMGPIDSAIWRVVLDLHLVKADTYEYDVRLGGENSAGVDAGHSLRPMWETLVKKRVDVVLRRPGAIVLVEVKDVSSFAALGQCLGYKFLWEKERRSLDRVSAMCVCAIVDPDLKPVFELYGVQVVSLPSEQAAMVLQHRQRFAGTERL